MVLPNYSINPVNLLCELFYNKLNGTLSLSVIPKGLLNIDDKILDELIIIMFYVRSHRKKIVDKNYIRIYNRIYRVFLILFILSKFCGSHLQIILYYY
jgi:hypothetical protein